VHPISPPSAFITDEVAGRPECLARAQRMISAMDPGEVRVVSLAELSRIAEDRDWCHTPRWGEIAEPRDPDYVFAIGRFDREEGARLLEAFPGLAHHDLVGLLTHQFRSDGEPEFHERTKGVVCQSAWQIHSMQGCPYRCAYCLLGRVNRVIVNIEDYTRHLDGWLLRDPSQTLYKWDNHGDVNCLEPEYDATRLFVDYFARRQDRYLEIYAGKSDNVDYLLPMEHRGRTIIQWSLAGPTQAEVFEPRTAAWDARIEAARKCEQAGYMVRFRLSPIIPVRNWRQENTLLVKRIYERTNPDIITLCPFGWMDAATAERCLDVEQLDPQFVDAMRAAAPFLRERGYVQGCPFPLPHDARYAVLKHIVDDIRRIRPEQTVALCLETEEMWRALQAELRQTSRGYVCNCGPRCTPGQPAYDRMVGRSRSQPS